MKMNKKNYFLSAVKRYEESKDIQAKLKNFLVKMNLNNFMRAYLFG